MASPKNDLVIDKAMASLYTKVFESSEGKIVLADLMKRFHAYDGIVLAPELRQGRPVDPLEMAMAVGQHQVICHLLACIEGNKLGHFKEKIAQAMTPR